MISPPMIVFVGQFTMVDRIKVFRIRLVFFEGFIDRCNRRMSRRNTHFVLISCIIQKRICTWFIIHNILYDKIIMGYIELHIFIDFMKRHKKNHGCGIFYFVLWIFCVLYYMIFILLCIVV